MRPSVSFCARLPFSTLARRGARIPAVFSVCARCSRIRNGAGPLFSCKRGPLEKYPTGIFFNSPPKMRPAAMGISPIAMGDAKGLCPFGFPTTFYKRWMKILSCGVATAIFWRCPRKLFFHAIFYQTIFNTKSLSDIGQAFSYSTFSIGVISNPSQVSRYSCK